MINLQHPQMLITQVRSITLISTHQLLKSHLTPSGTCNILLTPD